MERRKTSIIYASLNISHIYSQLTNKSYSSANTRSMNQTFIKHSSKSYLCYRIYVRYASNHSIALLFVPDINFILKLLTYEFPSYDPSCLQV
ncbi:hypothetical protein BLOT_014819 [Blomia tropicalis]|nr:hypothetical protein BLOT_014819 [Blomia tropicalis]